METNYHLLLQLILLSWAKWLHALPLEDSREISNDIFIDLDDSSDVWKKQQTFYELKNSPEEPFDFVIMGDIQPTKTKNSKDITADEDAGKVEKTTEGVFVYKKPFDETTKAADKGLDILNAFSTTPAPTTITSTTSTTTTTTTTTQRPKRKTSFWQSLKSIICNDFDLNKSIQENGNPLQPIIDAIVTVEHSETWKDVNTYATKTKEVIIKGYDELGHQLDNLKEGIKGFSKKLNI
ncbi:uncharacterized protein [Musca autumnalis]|uniref:uncharacterized protein n=1 Tax=Musca autumnalis TaxID=221902 RepID=UPI003CF08990